MYRKMTNWVAAMAALCFLGGCATKGQVIEAGDAPSTVVSAPAAPSAETTIADSAAEKPP